MPPAKSGGGFYKGNVMKAKSLIGSITICILLLGTVAVHDLYQTHLIRKLKSRLELSDSTTMVIAHRACWRHAAENSLKAVAACIDMGVDMIEIDVNRSSDGHLVIMHDRTVDRTTSGSGKVADFTLLELQSLKLKSGAGGPQSPLTDETVPTWREILELASGKILVNLDAKGEVRDQAIQEALELGVEGQILVKMNVGSPDDPRLKNAEFLRHGYFMPILREKNGPLTEVIEGFGTMAPVAYEVVYTNEKYFQAGSAAALNQGARLWVNTLAPNHSAGHVDEDAVVNPDAHWGHLIRLGANMIQTDNPKELLTYLNRLP